jgi:hypothetical protein
MLLKLYPRVHRRYTSLPILGPILDGSGIGTPIPHAPSGIEREVVADLRDGSE